MVILSQSSQSAPQTSFSQLRSRKRLAGIAHHTHQVVAAIYYFRTWCVNCHICRKCGARIFTRTRPAVKFYKMAEYRQRRPIKSTDMPGPERIKFKHN